MTTMPSPHPEPPRETDRPPIVIDEPSYDRLRRLATGAQTRVPEVAAALLEELDRAEITAPGGVPPEVITIGSEITYRDPAGEEHTVLLVYPQEADIAQHRVSVLTPIGAALIGLREGHEMPWRTRDGTERRLRVLKVLPPKQERTPTAG